MAYSFASAGRIARPPAAQSPWAAAGPGAPNAAGQAQGMTGWSPSQAQYGQAFSQAQGNQQMAQQAAQQMQGTAGGYQQPGGGQNLGAYGGAGISGPPAGASQNATAQAAQQLLSQGPQQPANPYAAVPQGMMDQGARMASAFQGLGQLGEMQRMGQDQMNRQGDLARAAALRNMRTPPSMMGQVGQIGQSAPAQNPYAGMLQSIGAASQARGYGVDPRSGQYFVNQGAAQNPGNQDQWAQMMRGLQGWGGR